MKTFASQDQLDTHTRPPLMSQPSSFSYGGTRGKGQHYGRNNPQC